MLFRFSSSVSLVALLQWNFIFAYLLAAGSIYLLVISFELLRGMQLAKAADKAQCGVIGKVGFGQPDVGYAIEPQCCGR